MYGNRLVMIHVSMINQPKDYYMEQNYSEIMRSSTLFDDDALLMQQVVASDYELLALDIILRSAYSSVDGEFLLPNSI